MVEVHNGSGAPGPLWYRVGQVQANKTIAWSNSKQFDYGWNPSVAMSGGNVVEAHNSSAAAGPLFYSVGQVQSTGTISWGASYQYDVGWNPKVALFADFNNILEVHNGGPGAGPMWYHWGNYSGPSTINFGPSIEYDSGENPSVAIGSRHPVEVHNGGSGPGAEWYHVGDIELIQ